MKPDTGIFAGIDLQLLSELEKSALQGQGINAFARTIKELHHSEYHKQYAIYLQAIKEVVDHKPLNVHRWPPNWRAQLADGVPGVAFPSKKAYGVHTPSCMSLAAQFFYLFVLMQKLIRLPFIGQSVFLRLAVTAGGVGSHAPWIQITLICGCMIACQLDTSAD
jgi:hypothetical protein